MFTAKEIKNNLLGCLEIFLFMPSGIERFGKTKSDALKSLIIPIALLPLTLMVIMALPEEAAGPVNIVLPIHIIRIVAAVVVFLIVVYYLAKQFNREEYFYRFWSASNWCNVVGLVMVSPIMIGVFSGYDMAVFESYAVFITLVGYVYSAFIITYCFKLPWEMGGFIAILGLAIDENLFDLAHYIKDSMMV